MVKFREGCRLAEDKRKKENKIRNRLESKLGTDKMVYLTETFKPVTDK